MGLAREILLTLSANGCLDARLDLTDLEGVVEEALQKAQVTPVLAAAEEFRDAPAPRCERAAPQLFELLAAVDAYRAAMRR